MPAYNRYLLSSKVPSKGTLRKEGNDRSRRPSLDKVNRQGKHTDHSEDSSDRHQKGTQHRCPMPLKMATFSGASTDD